MEVITTHINTDFDGFAAMIAAKRLYPGAELVFPGSQEKSVRRYLTNQFPNIYAFKKVKHIDTGRVRRLILVDTRLPDRIGRLAECLENPGLDIHLYDHHPDTPDDIHGKVEHVELLGSVITIFARLFQEKNIIPTADEATLMALGIYQDTGTFLHASTCPEDLQAASWLLHCGANLDIITQFVVHEMTAEQVAHLGKLLKNAVTYPFNATRVVLTRIELPEYVPNFSVIVKRMMVMENIDALFALISMAGRLYLIARSRIPEVNAGIVARSFGGGGHASAASATVRDMSLYEAEEKLIAFLHRHIKPKAIAGELMSSPVIAVTPDVSIKKTNDLMTRYNVTALPVTERGGNPETGEKPSGLQGIIGRMVTEKAIFHQLGELPVEAYMTTEIASLPESGTLIDIQKIILEHRQRLIPVVKGREILGVITRTDLLNLLVNDPANLSPDILQEDERPSSLRTRNMSRLMTLILPREVTVLLREIGETAEEKGVNAFVAGGFIRDLLLQTSNSDIDIVIEGDGIRFARALALKKKATIHPHERFKTATIVFSGNMRIDVATARLEYYDHPAALPTVEFSSIKLDLFRRDFTINAMALHLNPERFGDLVDFFNSQNDLKERRVQVLHNLSFVEDPTRIFRAVRFETRLDFRITKHTEKLIKNAVSMQLFDRFDGARFFHELKLLLSEDNPLNGLRRLEELQLFQFLWPDLRPNLKVDRRFVHCITQANQAISWFNLLYLDIRIESWMVYLLAIFSRSGVNELVTFSNRFELPANVTKKLIHQKTEGERIARDMLERPYMKPSEIYWLLGDLSYEGLLFLLTIAKKKHIQQAVSQYVTSYREETLLLNGHILKDMGYLPGPGFRVMLNHLLEMQLDGLVTTYQEAVSFIRSTYPLHDLRPV
ncbi:MAG: prohead protease [Desulfobulbus propionicus]|nr:MAG: prohead protease [Desulfobulbus propionicus]